MLPRLPRSTATRFPLRLALSLLTTVLGLVAATTSVSASDPDPEITRELERLRRHFGLNRALGVVVHDADTGRVLYEHNADRKFIPASGMKLAIMGASLHYLGPNYRFATEFLVDGTFDNGIVDGDLFVRGSGDPSLTHHEMDYIARSLANAGLRAIEGNILFDDGFFDDRLRGPASYDNILKQGLPIQSALSYNFNRVELKALPSAPGSRASLHDGGYGYFEVLNRVTTASRGQPWVRVQKVRGDRVVIRGRVIQGDEDERIGSFIAPNPTQYFASALVGKMAENGITIKGEVIEGQAAGDGLSTLYVHTSARLIEVLTALGKYSNNFSAEQMLKALGAHRWGGAGSFESGSRAVGEYLIGLGFRKDDFRIVDGSGLSYDNYLSASILARVLLDLYGSPELRTDFLCSLALGGVDGTLRRRFLNEDHMGRIMAKTGSLASVSSLSGLAFPPGRSAMIFSVITNGIGRQYRADHVEDEIARALLKH